MLTPEQADRNVRNIERAILAIGGTMIERTRKSKTYDTPVGKLSTASKGRFWIDGKFSHVHRRALCMMGGALHGREEISVPNALQLLNAYYVKSKKIQKQLAREKRA